MKKHLHVEQETIVFSSGLRGAGTAGTDGPAGPAGPGCRLSP
jgi:hypothetical protein